MIIGGFSFVISTNYAYPLDSSLVIFTAYAITDYIMFSAYYYRGTYNQKDSIARLCEGDQFRKDGSITSTIFKLESNRDTTTNVIYRKLVQIDEFHNRIKNSEILSIR